MAETPTKDKCPLCRTQLPTTKETISFHGLVSFSVGFLPFKFPLEIKGRVHQECFFDLAAANAAGLKFLGVGKKEVEP